MTRVDIHSPTNLVTEDYQLLGCGNFPTTDLDGYSPLMDPYAQQLLGEGWRFAENASSGGCYHCGAHLIYYAILMHMPTKTFVRVGETCLDNRFSLASKEFHRLRAERRLNRTRTALQDAKAAWFAGDTDRVIAFEWANYMVQVEGRYGYDGMRSSFVHGINRWGTASDKFVRAIMRDMARTERREAERLTATPVIEGRITITGEVVSIKSKDTDFGTRMVMTVKDERGFAVWGTVPSAIENTIERGSKVCFIATVTKSDTDETFGFFKRPAKAVIV